MAVAVIPRTYNNKPFIFYKGLDTNGDYGKPNGFVEYFEEADKYGPNQLTGRFYPDYKHIQHDTGTCNGNLNWIRTFYLWALFDDAGNRVSEPKKSHPLYGTLVVWTNDADEEAFTMIFGPDVADFDANGFARGVLGQDDFPVINTNPQRTDVPLRGIIPETEASMTTPPTHKYRTA